VKRWAVHWSCKIKFILRWSS